MKRLIMKPIKKIFRTIALVAVIASTTPINNSEAKGQISDPFEEDCIGLRYSTEPRFAGGNFLPSQDQNQPADLLSGKTNKSSLYAKKTIETDRINFLIKGSDNKSNYVAKDSLGNRLQQDNETINLGASVDLKILKTDFRDELVITPSFQYQAISYTKSAEEPNSNNIAVLNPGLKAFLDFGFDGDISIKYSARSTDTGKKWAGHEFEIFANIVPMFANNPAKGILIRYEKRLNIEDLVVDKFSFAFLLHGCDDNGCGEGRYLDLAVIKHPIFNVYEFDPISWKIKRYNKKTNWYIGISPLKMGFYKNKTVVSIPLDRMSYQTLAFLPISGFNYQPSLEAEYGMQKLSLIGKIGTSDANKDLELFYSVGLKGLF